MDRINQVYEKISSRIIKLNLSLIVPHINKYEFLFDDELKVNCKVLLDKGINEKESFSLINFFRRLFQGALIGNILDKEYLDAIALGVEAFNRAPADLVSDNGIRPSLYREQISTAIALVEGSLVQMNTGEGKTYAILPAAFTLFCKYKKVYIVCPNRYLAQRDASRTKPYWDFVGLSVSYCEYKGYTNWDSNIIYTTLDALIFTHLANEVSSIKRKLSIEHTAIIIDEADAVLLDEAWQSPTLIKNVKSDFNVNWDIALNIASEIYYKQTLEPDTKLIDIDEYHNSFLTQEGYNFVRKMLRECNIDYDYYNIWRHAIERSYIVISKDVKEDEDYKLDNNGRIHPFDAKKGTIRENQYEDWITPLEFKLFGRAVTPESIPLHKIPARIFIKKFQHTCGLSGSVEDDIMEYLFSFRLKTVIIKPPKERERYKKGEKEDLVWSTKKMTMHYLAEEIANTYSQRPVLVGVQTPKQVKILSEILLMKGIPHHKIEGLYSKNIADIFRQGGQIGSVIIATQLSGRGVDIRLSDEARQNGGLALFGLEHSTELRYDKQFLGRAGRQGDVFSAVFYVSLEDDLMQLFGSERIKNIMETLSLQEDELISHSMITNSIVRAQNKVRQNNFIKRRTAFFEELALEKIHNEIGLWFKDLQLQDDDKEKGSLSNTFLFKVVDKFINEHLIKLSYNISNDFNEDFFNDKDIIELCKSPKEKQLGLLRNKLADEIKEIERKYYKQLKEYDSLTYHQINYRFMSFNLYDDIVHRINDIIDFVHEMEVENDSNLILDLNKYDKLFTIKPLLEEEIITISNDLKNLRDEIRSSIFDKEFVLKYLYQLKNHFIIFFDFFETKLSDEKSKYPEIDKIKNRTFRNIAYWSIQTIWSNFLLDTAKAKRKLSLETKTTLEYNRAVSDMLIDSWNEIEKNISKEIVINLLKSKKVSNLDTLFTIEENEVIAEQKNKQSNENDYFEPQNIFHFKTERIDVKDLIETFIKSDDYYFDKLPDVQIKDTLKEFTNHYSISSLQEPEVLLKALKAWERKMYFSGHNLDFIKTKRKLVLQFLKFLHDNSYLTQLPTLIDKIRFQLSNTLNKQDNINQFANNFIFISTTLLLCGLSLFSIGDKHVYSDIFIYLENAIFGGLLSKSFYTAPVLGALFISAIYNNSKNREFLFIGSSVIFAAIMFHDIFTVVGAIKTIAISGSIFILSKFIYRNAIQIGEEAVGISLAHICTIFILVLFWLSNFEFFSIQTILFIAAIIIYSIWQNSKTNTSTIYLATDYIISDQTLKSQKVISDYKIKPLDYNAHIFTFSAILALYLLNLKLEEFNVVTYNFSFLHFSIVYIAIFLIKATSITSKKFSFKFWKENLHAQKRRIVDSPNPLTAKNICKNDKEIDTYLKLKKRRFLFKEIAFHSVLIIILSAIWYNDYLKGTQFPFVIFIIPVIVVFGNNISFVLKEFQDFFTAKLPASSNLPDVSIIQIKHKQTTPKKSIREFIKNIKLEKAVRYIIAIIFITYLILEILGL